MKVGAVANAVQHRLWREREFHPVRARDATQHDASQDVVVRGLQWCRGLRGQFDLTQSVLRVELFNLQPGERERLVHVVEKLRSVEQGSKSVGRTLAHESRDRIKTREFNLKGRERLDTLGLDSRLLTPKYSSSAVLEGRALLVGEFDRRPGHPASEVPSRVKICAQSHVPDD